MQFGRSSEQLREQIAQLELEELEAEPAAADDAPLPVDDAAPDAPTKDAPTRSMARRPLPAHLPRREVEHPPAGCTCAECCGNLRQVGADVTEVLDYIPGRFEDKPEFHGALGGFVAEAAQSTGV